MIVSDAAETEGEDTKSVVVETTDCHEEFPEAESGVGVVVLIEAGWWVALSFQVWLNSSALCDSCGEASGRRAGRLCCAQCKPRSTERKHTEEVGLSRIAYCLHPFERTASKVSFASNKASPSRSKAGPT